MLEILAEWAADEAHAEEARGRPGVFAEEEQPPNVDGLPRLRGKQPPSRGWEHVPIPDWVRQAQHGQSSQEEESEEAAVEEAVEAVAVPEEEPAPKRARKDSRVCPGKSAEEPCLFSREKRSIGNPAQLARGKDRCQFCDAAALATAAANKHGKRHVTGALRAWVEAGRQDIADAALARIPEAHQKHFEQALQRPSRTVQGKAAQAKAKAEAREAAVQKTLEHRRSFQAEPQEEEQQAYRRKVADDNRRLRRKFGPLLQAREEKDNTWRSSLAARFEEWSREHSWAACQKCHRLVTRPLHEGHISTKRVPAPTIPQCKHCAEGVGYPTVSHTDIPEELRNLSADVLWALRPLEPDVGQRVAARHGYPVHTDMIRFWWRPATVPDQIEQLDKPEDRDVARKAYQYLMASEASSYKQFVAWQRKVLRKHAGVLEGEWDRKLQLPRHALEEVGLECAVWPHLYPRTNMCETYVRQQDARRKERAKAAPQAAQQRPASGSKAPAGTSCSSTSSSSTSSSTSSTTTTQASPAAIPEGEVYQSEPEDTETEPEDEGSDGEVEAAAPLDFARQGRNSAKSAYLAKVLGPVLGYGATYELFQFVYDLWLWSTVGAKKHSVDAPLRLAMQGYGFSPEYWQTRHAALVDTVLQLGLPTLFITIAPYECLGLVSETFSFLFMRIKI